MCQYGHNNLFSGLCMLAIRCCSLKNTSTVGVVMLLVNTSLGSGVTGFVYLSWGYIFMTHWLHYRVLLMIPSMCLCV